MGYFVLFSANNNAKGLGKKRVFWESWWLFPFRISNTEMEKGFFLIFLFFYYNVIASTRQFRGTTLSGRIDASLSHSHIHRIALRRGSFPKQFPHPSPDCYLVYILRAPHHHFTCYNNSTEFANRTKTVLYTYTSYRSSKWTYREFIMCIILL